MYRVGLSYNRVLIDSNAILQFTIQALKSTIYINAL